MFVSILIATIFGPLTILVLFALYVRLNRTGRMINRFPGPYAYPIIGNMLDLYGNEENIFKKLRKLNAEYYPIYRFLDVHLCAVHLLHPDDIEAVLSDSKHIEKSQIYNFLHPWLSTGLLTSTGAKWHKRRKILTPAFHFNILRHFVNILNEQSQDFVKMLKKEAEGGPIVKDLIKLIGEYTLNAICETAMGISIRENKAAHTMYQDAVKTVSKFTTFRLLRPWYRSDFLFNLSPSGRLQKKQLKILHSFTENIIAERKRYHESTNRKYLQNFDAMEEKSMNSEIDVSGSKRRLAMLDLLISASLEDDQIDDKGIREEVDTFTFEGHDTTSIALCYALLLFAKHKDVQERIRKEVNEVMLKEDNKMSISVLQNFSYLERALKESLRLYPSGPFISRLLQQDCQLKNYTIPAGALCNIHIYDVHRDPAFWPNPLVFDPDRFLPENMKGRHPYSYIPFSAGLRNCIGQKFAMLEMKLAVAHILHNFALESVIELDNVTIVADLVLRPAHALPVKFIPLR